MRIRLQERSWYYGKIKIPQPVFQRTDKTYGRGRGEIFLIKGGIVALLSTVTLYALIDGYDSPLLIGFVEETAKVLTILFLVDHRNYRYILNGMLSGSWAFARH